MNLFLYGLAVLVGLPVAWLLGEALWDRRHFYDHSDDDFIRNIRSRKTLQMLRQQADLTVIDVRPSERFIEGHLPGAIHAPFSMKGQVMDETLEQVSQAHPLLVYCDGGFRSRIALAGLRNQGFRRIYHLHRGFLSWKRVGGAVETGERTTEQG